MQTPDHKQDEKSGWSRLKQVIDWSGMSVNRFAGAVGLQRSESLYQIKKRKKRYQSPPRLPDTGALPANQFHLANDR